MDKAISEIAKLTDRISKDPKSKLFVPLAEEYRKAGDIEMAIHVLSEGLKINSGYVTARSVLGKLLFEQGNIEGSRKEFEEVVKAIPDNLMAQRKLGDIYVLQHKPSEALKHYKIVFTFNPRDEEISTLIADLEAGSDIRTISHVPEPQPAPETEVKQGSPSVSSVKTPPQPQAMTISATASAPATAEMMPQAVGPGKESKIASGNIPPSMASAGTQDVSILDEVAPAPTSLTTKDAEEETPEEVLVVEPLDTALPEPASTEPGLDFLSEESHESFQTSAHEASDDTLFVEPVFLETADVQETSSVAVESTVPAESADASIAAGEQATGSLFEDMTGQRFVEFPEVDLAETTEPLVGTPVVPAASEALVDKSDDFTTDTLAELYIAQGFYEKAIDIYQRMLADKPTSKGLKDKLERVKAMAGDAAAAQAGPVEGVAAGTDVQVESETVSGWNAENETIPLKGNAEAREYIPPVEAEEITIEAEVVADLSEEKGDENFFVQAREYRSGVEELPASANAPALDSREQPPAQEQARAKPLFSDFEPREYVVPKKESEPDGPAEAVAAAPVTSKPDKKVTIDRLETWLKNIKKEI